MKIKIKSFIFAAGMWLAQLMLFACGGAAPQWSDFQTAQFFGAGKVTPNNDGTWTLWWPVMTVSDGVTYNVYQEKAGNPFTFEKPTANTAGNTYQTADLRLSGNTCFVVRALQNGDSIDTNTKEVCTHHESYSFGGIKELVSLKDGTYMVRWDAPPFSGAVFQVFSKKKDVEKLTPIALSEQSFYQTVKIPLSETVCFVVRHRIQNFPEDQNTKEVCTSQEDAGGFAGIEAITSPEKGAIKVWWKPSTREDVASYKIYLGTTFRKSIATLNADDACSVQNFDGEERKWCSFQQNNLPHAASYTYAVRAVDVFEREDDNRKAKTFELLNHPPVVATVKVVPNITTGRPTSLTCEASYSDVDTWQTLIPKFVFKNRTRELAHEQEVELQKETLSAGVQSTKYTLKPSDKHGDLIVCEASVEDGFGGTHVLKSAPADPTEGIGTSFLIPDTPAVATTIFDVPANSTRPAFLYGARNSMREINVTLNAGYTDIDQDVAKSITFTEIINANVCLISDSSCSVDAVGAWPAGGEKTFLCEADGTCKFQFVPGKDHFTNPQDLVNTLAVVKYRINVADIILPDGTISAGSTSSTLGEFRVNVRPAPRATGFSFKNGFQDEPYLLTKDAAQDMSSGVLRGFTPGMGWMGFESKLKITKMFTRISTNASDQVSERPNGEFFVTEMLAKEPGSIKCKTETYTASEFSPPEKTVNTECEITCRRPKNEEIDRIYGTTGLLDSDQITALKDDADLSICPFLFKPDPGFYGTAVFYYSVLDFNGLPSDYARGEMNFTPSLRAIGHKVTVIEGENAAVEFKERTDEEEDLGILTGIDGTSEDVSVLDINVKDSQLLYGTQAGTLFFSCGTGTNVCTTTVPSILPGGSWPGFGHANYVYRIKGWDSKNNKTIFSNWCPGQSAADPANCEVDVHFYPKPRATNPIFYVLEASTSQLSFMAGSLTSQMGYFHPYSDSATLVKVKNNDNSKGTINLPGGGLTGEVACMSGACPVSFTANSDPCGSDWSNCSMDFKYSIVTLAPPDSDLGSLARRSIESEDGTAIISIRPIPVPNDMAFIKPEGMPFTITITKGVQPGVNGETGGYTYPLEGTGTNAESIEIIGAIPDGGKLQGTGFQCLGLSCTAVYEPAAEFTGDTSFKFKVSIFDQSLNKKVQSEQMGTINIKLRPIVKATGLKGDQKIYAVEGLGADFERQVVIKRGPALGYTHVENFDAVAVNTATASGAVSMNSNGSQMGLMTQLGSDADSNPIRFDCNVVDASACEGIYASIPMDLPNWPGYGEGKFWYTVTVNDIDGLGLYTSKPAEAFVDVRPVPRAIGDPTKPNGPETFLTIENLPRKFYIKFNQGYTHPYNYKAKALGITSVDYGNIDTTEPPYCDPASGACEFIYNPPVTYPVATAGKVKMKFSVTTFDDKANFAPYNGNLKSKDVETIITVYPRPRATNKNVVGLQNKVIPVVIEPNAPSNDNNGGYAHPFGDKALCVTVSNLKKGTVSPFSCNGDGVCSADFMPEEDFYSANADEANLAGFRYNVYIQKEGVDVDQLGVCDGTKGLPIVSSDPEGKVLINVRPVPVATGYTAVNKQADAFEIEFSRGEGLGYKDLVTPPRPATAVEFKTKPSPSTVGTLSEWTCQPDGKCTTLFTPVNQGQENAYFGTFDASYVVYMYDALTKITVVSDPAVLRVKVRPRPKGTNVAEAQKQGQNHVVRLSAIPPVYTHPENIRAYRVDVQGVNADYGTLGAFGCTEDGTCIASYAPRDTGGVFYWGKDIKFDYRVVVNDPDLKLANGNTEGAGDIEGFWKSYAIEYRPVPEPTGLNTNVFVKEGGSTSVVLDWGSKADKKGYAHGDSTFNLRASSISTTNLPGFLGFLGDFDCSSAVNKKCEATFTAPTSGTTYGFSKFNYRVTVTDDVLGDLQSYTTAQIQIQIKPSPKATGRLVKGVQNANKLVYVRPGTGYSYPYADFGETLVGTRVEAVVVDTPKGGSITDLTCVPATGLCTGTFVPSVDYTGEANFKYKVSVFDPDLGKLESNTGTYKIDYYPSPVALPLLEATNNYILASEGSSKIFSFLPAKKNLSGVANVFCVSSHEAYKFPHGYLHPFCSPGVEIIVDTPSITNLNISDSFDCYADGKCEGEVTPNAPGGSWLGYGFAEFNYQVRINPPELADLPDPLTTDEIANLTSNKVRAQVEFYPLPKTKDLEFWAIQDTPLIVDLSRCSKTLIADCDKGYVHGYDKPASKVLADGANNLTIEKAFECFPDTSPIGLCQFKMMGAPGYYSSQSNPADRATIDFRMVVIAGAEEEFISNKSKLKFNVYPKPQPVANFKAEGVQNEELVIVFKPGTTYTHVAGGKAKYVTLPKPTEGTFVNTANCAVYNAAEDTCNKYNCDANGWCEARFRGFRNPPGTPVQAFDKYYGKIEPFFRIELHGPAGMPEALKANLFTDYTKFEINILPKPIAQDLPDFILKEGGQVAFQIKKSVADPEKDSTTPLTGYWHPEGGQATSILIQNPTIVSSKIRIFGLMNGTPNVHLGNLDEVFSCQDGVCSNSFVPLVNKYGLAKATFKVTVNNDSRLTSDEDGDLIFDIRPLPRSLDIPVVRWPEDKPYPVEIGQDLGFSHPYNIAGSTPTYLPTNIITYDLEADKGSLGTWVYPNDAADTPKVATNTLTPKDDWIPNAADNRVFFRFSVSTYDNVLKDQIQSNTMVKGKVEIEYRPKARVKDLSAVGIENSDKVFVFTPGTATTDSYTHVYNLRATDIKFQAANGNMLQDSISCNSANGECTVTFKPTANYYGVATIKYSIKVVDTALPGTGAAQDIWSDWATLSVDFRPLPRGKNLLHRNPQDRDLNLSFGTEKPSVSYTVAYAHPYFTSDVPNQYVAKSIKILNLSQGIFVGAGVTASLGVFTIPCNATGVCNATYQAPAGFTGAVNYDYKVLVTDLVLNQDLESPVLSSPAQGKGEIRVRPVPTALSFNVAAPENKTAENRATTIKFGLAAAGGKGYDYPNADLLPIHNVTILNQDLLNGTLSTISCASGICSTDYIPTAGVKGPASFTFKVWADDSEIGPVSSNTEQTVSIDIRARPVIAPFTKNIAENILDHPTTTPIEIILNNAANYGYKQDNNLKAFEIVTSSPINGAIGTTNCDASTGVCTVEFTPTLDFSLANASFTYKIKVRDLQLGNNPLTNVLETDEGTITLPVRKRPVASNVTFYAPQGSNRVVTVAKDAGYTHALFDAVGVVVKTWDNVRLLNQPAFVCTSGTCTSSFSAKDNTVLGTADVGFQVKITDSALGSDLLSNTATAKVIYKGTPKIQGSPHVIKMIENTFVDISFSNGVKYDYNDTDNWTSIQDKVRINISGADKGTFDGGLTDKQYNCNGTGVCTVRYTASTNQYGLDELSYTVSVLDPHLGLLTSSATGTINVNIRPRPKATVVGTRTIYQNVTGTTASEGGVVNFTEGTEFTYAYKADAAEFDNMRIIASSPTKGLFYDGSSLVNTITNSCVSNVCAVKYVPNLNEVDGASFSYKIRIYDKVLQQDLDSVEASTVAVDIYPRPVCNNVLAYATQNDTPTLRVALGASSGYTHGRNHLASTAVRVASTNTNGDTPANVNCDAAGNCDFVFTPSPAHFYTTQDGNTKAKFNFNVNVGGTNCLTPATAEAVMRPKPIAEPPTGVYVFEGRPTTITIAKSPSQGANQGYFHPYTVSGTDYRGRASEVAVVGTLGGATDSSTYTCTAGSCSVIFTPSSILTTAAAAAYGAGKATFDYTVKTGTAAPWFVTSAAGSMSMNLRPVPKITNINLVKIENTSLTLNVGPSQNGYVWGATALTQENPKAAETFRTAGFDTNPAFTCNGSGPCTVDLNTAMTPNFNRGTTSATASFKYRIQTRDPVSAQDVWSHEGANSTWATVTIDVAPLPYAQTLEVKTGIEGMPRSLTLSRGANSGYTHVQNFNATAIIVDSCTNCQATPTFDCSSPGSNGQCTSSLTPAATFTDITGEPNSPTTNTNLNHTSNYGWAKIVYRVRVNDPAAGNVTSAPGTLWVYFRPVPKPSHLTGSPLAFTNGIEGQNYTLNIAQTNGWLYALSASRPVTGVATLNVAAATTGMGASTVTVGTCASGVCPVTVAPPASYKRFGTMTFDYNVSVTDADGITVSTADKTGAGPGRVSVKFRALPRAQNIDQARLLGTTGVYTGKAVETCKEDNTHLSAQIPVLTIAKSTFNDSNGAPTQTNGYYHYDNLNANSVDVVSGSSSNGDVTANSCSGGTCEISWRPRCWNDGENEITGSFNFKITDTENLQSTAAATATIAMIPRVRTTGRTYDKDNGDPGIAGVAKAVQISHGTSNGYTHIYSGSGKNAAKLRIISGGSGYTGLTVGQEITCTSGVCSFNVTPSVSDATATVKYKVIDNDGFISRNTGDLNVYFVSRPVVTSVSQVVGQGSTGNLLTISLGAGYTHPANEKAVGVIITDTTNLNAASGTGLTNTSFTCNTSGICTASYTPNPTFSTADPGVSSNLASFRYKVKLANNVESSTDALYSIDVFPKPVARAQNFYWVQGMGRNESGVSGVERYRVNLTKGSSTSNAYNARGSTNASSIEGLNVVQGSGSWTEGLSCSGSTCTGRFNPSAAAYSSSSSATAVRSEYKVRVSVGSMNVDSDLNYLNFYIMPQPTITNTALQVWEDQSKEYAFLDTAAPSATPEAVAAYWYPWSTGHSMTKATSPTGIIASDFTNCNLGSCRITINPNGSSSLVGYSFTYTFTANAYGDWPLSITTSAGTASVSLRKVLLANDYQPATVTQVLGASTTVPLTLARGTDWLDQRNSSGVVDQVELLNTSGENCGNGGDAVEGTLGSFTSSDGGNTFNATFTTVNNNLKSFGYWCYNYRVKRNGTPVLYSNYARLTIFVRPQDNPADVCDKTREGTVFAAPNLTAHGTSVIAYPSQARLVKAKRAGCGNDGWYLDPDNSYTDRAISIQFVTAPSSGSIAGCGGNGCELSCDASGDCPFTYNPPASTGIANFSYRVFTQNSSTGAQRWSPTSPGKFQIVSPPTPYGKTKNVTVNEDAGVPIVISTTDTTTMRSLEEMSLRDGDDGYPWVVNSANWTGCNVGMNINPPMPISCDMYGNCSTTIPTYYDSNTTTTCNWTVTVNGVVSSPAGSVVATITPIDDPPQTYANGTDLAAATSTTANESVHHYSYHGMCWSRTDWAATFVDERTTEIRIQRAGSANAIQTYGDCYHEYGYLERDGDRATHVLINTASRSGIGSDQPTISGTTITWGTGQSGIATGACGVALPSGASDTCMRGLDGLVASACDANGRCKGSIRSSLTTPGTATFQYKVRTCFNNGATCTWQPTWSTYNLEVSAKPRPVVSKEGANAVAQGGVSPIVFTHQWPPNGYSWNGSDIPTEAGKYYGVDFRDTAYHNWWRTKVASGVVTTNLTGASSVEFTCDWDTGVCVGMFNTAPGYTGAGGFDYQVRVNGDNRPGKTLNLVIGGADTGWGSSLNYGQRLMADSTSKRWPVDVKPIPIPTGLSLITAINTPITVTLQMGAGLGYTHAGNSPATAITVQNASLGGGTLGSWSCDAAGVCTATYTPTSTYEGSATFDYFVTDNQSPNKFTSANSGTVTIQVKPMIIVSDLTRIDLTEGATTSLNLAKQTYPTSGTLTGEGYAHKDNAAVGTLTANTFSSGSLSGTGVSCSSGTCTVNCAGDGDSDNNRCTFNFVPSSSTFYGTATFKFTLTSGSVTSPQKDASLTFKARPTLKSTAWDLTTGSSSGIQGQDKTLTIDYSATTTGEYGYTHPTAGKATALTITNLNNAAVVGTPSCDVNGLCTVVMRHSGTSPNNFGATSFSYNVTVGGLAASSARNVNLTFHEIPVSVADKSATTDKDTTVLITINKGDEYTLSGSSVATRVVTSNVQNGQTVQVANGTTVQNDFTCDGSGNCNLKFKPTAGYEGNAASFDFVVYKDLAPSVSRKFSVKVDGGPTATARNLTGGSGGTAHAVTISLGTGYTDPNNDPATSLETQTVSNGVLSTINCDAAGICTGVFTPNTTFTGNATFQFRVTTTDSTRVSGNTKTSAWATYTLASAAADEAPVATGKTITSANRTSQSVTIGLNNGYTDTNSDKASALTIVGVDGATTSTPTCNSTTGDCTFNVYTQGGTFGQSVVQYTVTANSKTSNSGIIRLSYASNSAYGCVNNLAWSSISLSDTCGLSLAATPTLSSCSLTTTEGAFRNISTGGVAANSGGVSATLTSFSDTNTTFSASWKVISDLDDSASLQRTLQLTSAAATNIRMTPLALTPVRSQGMAGLQAPVAGCAGTCALDYGAAAGSLASSAGGSISVGSEFACSANGNDVSCWGRNTYGQLGNGNNTDQSYASQVSSSGLNGSNLVAVSAGSEFACGLLTSGEVACWGRNDKGQLGDTTTTNSNVPVYVKRNATTKLTNIVAVAAGDKHACAISGTKTVWCWGDGAYGALGVGDVVARSSAATVKVSGSSTAANLTNAIAVSAHGNQSCIIQDVSGVHKALCWGRNDLGQLARGTQRNSTVNVSSVDVPTDRFTATAHGLLTGDAVTFQGSGTVPVGISSATRVYYVQKVDNNTFEVVPSSDSTTAVLIDSTGASVVVNKVFPYPSAIKTDASTELTNVQRLSLQTGTTCALLTNGTVRCAGDNTSGATGRNVTAGTTDYATLVRNTDNTADLANVVEIDSGNQHACALLNTGAVQCWGANASGQLGNGSTTAAALPVNVSSLSGAVGFAGGGASSCALVRSVESSVVYGRVKCWGSNPAGLLGNGNAAASASSVGNAVKSDASTSFQSRLRDCDKVYSVSELP